MDQFSGVYDVCRAALAGDRALAMESVKRLRDAISSSGDLDDAELLSRLIKAFDGKSNAPVVHFTQSEAGDVVEGRKKST